MARKMIILALVFVAILGLVSAQAPAESPKQSTKTSSAPPPDSSDKLDIIPSAAANPDNDVIGDGSSSAAGPSGYAAEAAPIGGPVPAEAFRPTASDEANAPASGASAAQRGVSAIVGVSAIAGLFFF